ncbi:MAG: DUF465 domain-containing protein [Deltaproteobacteria bacterium]|nr:DUF465 domain-containing protein [Deltaproteobacteria bacterium]
MDENNEKLVQLLMEENPRYRKLYEEHLFFEKELERFNQKRFLIPEEEIERKKLQKLKLAGKDEMEQILREASA